MPPHEMIQHPVLDPRLFPGPIPQYMTVFNSGIPPEYVIPQQGRSDLRVPGTGRSEPFANQMQEQFGNFPQQSPAMSQRSPAFSQQSLAFSQQQPPFPHQSQSGFASGRGGFGKGRGRGSFSGPTVPPGRKGSFNLKGTYNGPPGRHGSNNQPINLPIRPEPKPATQNKEIIHPAVGDKGKHPVCETEQFPEYTESGYEVHDQLRDSEKCFPKFIGPDVEEMTQLWVGNIEPSTKSEEFQAFIQTHVPVLNIRPILPDSVDANTWTFVNFHSTTDAREALRYFDKLPFKNIALDVQVPERFRSDVQGVKKYQDRKYSGPRQEHQNSVSSSRRNSVGHRNSFRKERTSSNLGEGRPRRNSVFSPQDARSDLPDLQESLSPPAEQSADTSNSERKSSPKKKGYKKNNKAEGINNGSAAGPTSRRQSKVSKNVNTVNTSFSQTKPTSSDVGSTTSRSAADPTPPDSDSRSEPTLSLQHTSQGRPVFVLDLEEPVIEPSSNEKGTSESQNEESTAPSQSGSSEGDESKAVSNTGKASKKKKAARANTGESRIPQTMAPPEPVVAENVDKVNAAPVECGTEDVAPPVETKQKTAVLDDLAKETDELKDQSGDVDQPEVHSAIEGPVESNAEEISPQGDSMGPLPEITIENSTGPSPSDKSTLPVASATEEKKPESLEDALASPRKAKAVETGSIHPFARKKQQQDQAAKADKKKQKKQSQAGKKGTKTAADIAAKPSQNQEKIRAGSFSSTDTRPDLTRAASPASNAPSAISGNGRGHEAKLSVASSSVASQPEFVPSDEAREKLNPSLDHSGAADPLSQAGLSKQPSPRKSSRPANIVIALPLSFNKRSSSSAIPGNGSSAETKPTTGSPEANAASDTSSPMATPHTARTHQPSAQSPMPILMSSSPLADTTAQPTVGLGISAPEQTLEADVVATLTPEQAQPGAELDAITSDSTKPKKPKKKTNKKKKGKAGEGTEDATASTAAPGGSGGDDGKALPERCQDNDAELGKSYDPGSTSNFADEQDATFRKAASVLKENSPMKLVPSTYAQAAAPNSKGLSARSPNLPASRPA
ncbi:hypothetical protein EJ08DRAFT_646207 [Tothia fuscella]|uniref:RRM domain-containing protein n=1 Tax=Tothia fuscella TaxID=1048955 RepID=A0A9P4NZR6_9PEZI|nr:hypothetical protein EJ08DRAFT_646207 [Tothia fuscella]